MTSTGIDPQRTLCRIQFRFVLGDVDSPSTSRLFYVYKDKWSRLMSYVLSKKDNRIYDDLPELRKVLPNDVSVIDILKFSDFLDQEGLRLLVEAQALFNLAPRDLKSYILAVFGLRAWNFDSSENNNK